MRIALVHDFLNTWGGGEYVLKVFTELYPEAPIYSLTYKQAIVDEFFPGRKIIPSFLQNYPGMPDKFKYYLSFMPKAIESFDFSDYDVVLSDSSAYAKGAITKGATKHVCYLHTPTRYLWSDREEYIKNAPIPLPIIGRSVVKGIVKKLQKWDLEAAKRPDVIIANSKYIAERTRTYYHRDPEYVVFPPVNVKQFKIGTPGDYFLVLARAEPYKRTDLAIQAANKLGLKLKVVGGGTKIKYLQEMAGPNVEFLGRVSEEEKVRLFSGCLAFIFPPKEDAGITPLEAMASGRPVIAYSEGGALESVVEGETGEFFSDQTVDSLVEVLKVFDPSNYNPQKIRQHADKFDKEIFKNRIQQIVNDALSSDKR
ncbi:MAG: glycosyltransferase [Candidatus Berkelbacteria bacterium]|nr:MAG: glycosyltransferase [Candidatus Berkelbacteria bacterium]QQG52066.1 MAG: glycosyltransferase [Candidatus Berkelbacteria bacterium]